MKIAAALLPFLFASCALAQPSLPVIGYLGAESAESYGSRLPELAAKGATSQPADVFKDLARRRPAVHQSPEFVAAGVYAGRMEPYVNLKTAKALLLRAQQVVQ